MAQQAIEQAVQTSDRQEWVSRVRSRPRRVRGPLDTSLLLDTVREEFGV